MITTKTNLEFNAVLGKELKQYFSDYYNGKIKASCDEDCKEGCNIDHGFIELPTDHTNLFD